MEARNIHGGRELFELQGSGQGCGRACSRTASASSSRVPQVCRRRRADLAVAAGQLHGPGSSRAPQRAAATQPLIAVWPSAVAQSLHGKVLARTDRARTNGNRYVAGSAAGSIFGRRHGPAAWTDRQQRACVARSGHEPARIGLAAAVDHRRHWIGQRSRLSPRGELRPPSVEMRSVRPGPWFGGTCANSGRRATTGTRLARGHRLRKTKFPANGTHHVHILPSKPPQVVLGSASQTERLI